MAESHVKTSTDVLLIHQKTWETMGRSEEIRQTAADAVDVLARQAAGVMPWLMPLLQEERRDLDNLEGYLPPFGRLALVLDQLKEAMRTDFQARMEEVDRIAKTVSAQYDAIHRDLQTWIAALWTMDPAGIVDPYTARQISLGLGDVYAELKEDLPDYVGCWDILHRLRKLLPEQDTDRSPVRDTYAATLDRVMSLCFALCDGNMDTRRAKP